MDWVSYSVGFLSGVVATLLFICGAIYFLATKLEEDFDEQPW